MSRLRVKIDFINDLHFFVRSFTAINKSKDFTIGRLSIASSGVLFLYYIQFNTGERKKHIKCSTFNLPRVDNIMEGRGLGLSAQRRFQRFPFLEVQALAEVPASSLTNGAFYVLNYQFLNV